MSTSLRCADRCRAKRQMITWRHEPIILLAVLISAFMSPRHAAAQSTTRVTAKAGSREPSSDSEVSQMPPTKLPLCPEAGVPVLHSSKVTGHHRVTLTWKASAPSPHQISNPVGYCLYRSKRHGLPKMAMAIPNVRCGGCEQVNRVPIASIGCTDDLVEDNTTYYYVVTAISRSGLTSSSSNESIVEVPGRKPNADVSNAYPSCRASGLSR